MGFKNPTRTQVLDWAWHHKKYYYYDLYVYTNRKGYAFLIKPQQNFCGDSCAEDVPMALEDSVPRRLILNQNGDVILAPLGQGLLPHGQFVSARPLVHEILMDAWGCKFSGMTEILLACISSEDIERIVAACKLQRASTANIKAGIRI